MDNTNVLERLSQQVDALVGALQQARAESAELREQLRACQAQGQEQEDRIGALQEQLGFNDMEMEDLATRIEQALAATDAPVAAPEPLVTFDSGPGVQSAEVATV